jgi:TnpA family transposase
MLRKFGSYPRPNGLAIALRELGRIERSLFILGWLQSVDLRRRVHAGLNKGEARNALAGRNVSMDLKHLVKSVRV